MKDKERLDWLEKSQMSLISDDCGNWAVACDGFQNVPKNPPDDIETMFWIEKARWCKNTRGAIDRAIKIEQDETEQDK